jgi:hypothetical protein
LRECKAFIWIRIGSGDGLFEYANEPSGFMQGREFFDQLSNISFSKNYTLCYITSRLKESSVQILKTMARLLQALSLP